jgi:hypothetical protein
VGHYKEALHVTGAGLPPPACAEFEKTIPNELINKKAIFLHE